MIPIVEEMLKTTVEQQLKRIKADTDIIDRVFRCNSQQGVDKFKKFIDANNIKVVVGYPREPAVLPCYSILLSGEDEQYAGLGETIDSDYDEDSLKTVETTVKVLKNMDGQIYVQLPNRAIDLIEYLIRRNDPEGDPSDIVDVMFVITDPAKGIVVIRSKEIQENDTLEVKYQYFEQNADCMGTMMTTSYRIECWSDNGDLTTYMYHVLKYILLSSRLALIQAGLMQPRLGGTDLEPVPEYFPSFVYRRALSLSIMVDNTFDELFDVITDVNVELLPLDYTKQGGELQWTERQ